MNPTTNLDSPPGPQPAQDFAEAPVWLQRLFAITYVIFCVTLGVWLVTLPWTGFWFENGRLDRWPEIERLLQNGFVRGLVSGLGLVDIWLGISETIHYRDRRPAAAPAPSLDRVTHDQQQ